MTSKANDTLATSPPGRQLKSHLDTIAIVLLLICCLAWGLQQVLVKATIPELAPMYQSTIRFSCALILVLIWCRFRKIRLFERDGSLWPGLLAGALFAGEFTMIYIGLIYGPASRLTVFLYTSPFWVAMLVPLIVPAEKLRPLQWVGLACAFSAVALALSGGNSGGHSEQWIGDAFALIAGFFWGLTTVVIRASKSLMRVPAEKLLIYQLAVSVVAFPILSVLRGETWTTDFSTFAITSLAIQTILGAFFTYLAWMWMLSRYPATKLSVFVFLTPLFALAFGALWLKEPVTPTLLISIALVAVGIVLVNFRKN